MRGRAAGADGIGHGVPDPDLLGASDADDLAGPCVLDLGALESVVHVEPDDLGRHHLALVAKDRDRVSLAGNPRGNAPDRQATHVVVVVEVVDEHLQRGQLAFRRRRYVLENGVEQRLQVLRLERARDGVGGPSLAGDAVQHGEVNLALVGAEVDVERVDEVKDLLGPRVLPVDLVDDEHRWQAQGESLGEHESSLREGSLGGVDEQEDPVDEPQRSLDLAPEIGMARRVDDVDLHPLPSDGRVLGEDGDALLALQVVRVHDSVDHQLVRPEDAGLSEHVVDKSRLAVVDVGHDGHVADAVARDHGEPGGGAASHIRPERLGQGESGALGAGQGGASMPPVSGSGCARPPVRRQTSPQSRTSAGPVLHVDGAPLEASHPGGRAALADARR